MLAPRASVTRVKKGAKGRAGAGAGAGAAWGPGVRGASAEGAEGGCSDAGEPCEASFGRAEGRSEGVLLEEVGRGIFSVGFVCKEVPERLSPWKGLHFLGFGGGRAVGREVEAAEASRDSDLRWEL